VLIHAIEGPGVERAAKSFDRGDGDGAACRAPERLGLSIEQAVELGRGATGYSHAAPSRKVEGIDGDTSMPAPV
jgi:hypothetical protein